MNDNRPGTALITGASAGIGATYADRLARRGHDLILVARDRARMEQQAARLHRETGRDVAVHPADLTDPAALAELGRLIEGTADLRMVVNNAGLALPANFVDVEAHQLLELLSVNVVAAAVVARAAARAFRQRGTGAIINLSSVVALNPEDFDPAYSATKAFVLNLTQGLAAQLEPKGVRVQAVLPGATRTEIWGRSGKDADAFPAEIMMSVDDLVDAALVGFDRGETVTIPPMPDESQFDAMQAARRALANLSRREVAPRYRVAAHAGDTL